MDLKALQVYHINKNKINYTVSYALYDMINASLDDNIEVQFLGKW